MIMKHNDKKFKAEYWTKQTKVSIKYKTIFLGLKCMEKLTSDIDLAKPGRLLLRGVLKAFWRSTWFSSSKLNSFSSSLHLKQWKKNDYEEKD